MSMRMWCVGFRRRMRVQMVLHVGGVIGAFVDVVHGFRWAVIRRCYDKTLLSILAT